MTEAETSLPQLIFKQGAIFNTRLKSDLADELNNFAAMRHITNKTDALHRYVEFLKGEHEKIIPQVQLLDTIRCPAWHKEIALDHCWSLQDKEAWKSKYCKGCRGERKLG